MTRRTLRKSMARGAWGVLAGCMLLPVPSWAQRNLDAREAVVTRAPEVAPAAAQASAVDGLRAAMPELAVKYDRSTGATRMLSNRGGYLTAASRASAENVARAFVTAQSTALGLSASDVSDLEVTDTVRSRVTGATHVYLRQRHGGLPVYNGSLHVTVNRDGRVLGVSNTALPGIQAATAASRAGTPSAATAAIAAAGESVGEELDARDVQLMWLPIVAGNARLVWNFNAETADQQHHYDFTVDALTGQVWTRLDWTQDADYRVYEGPTESPNHATPLPPADARSLVVGPEDPIASSLGWHDTGSASFTTTQGNNVHAYDDSASPVADPDCGVGLVCDFPLDLTQAPAASKNAAITNLFYWNNLVHDIQYQYGFDEAAGNFQENNFGNGGNGGDSVNAEAQDKSGNCNANMTSPPDGGNPRMQMYTCNEASPSRDGDFDNGVIVHEYGHGISIRQAGGPSNSNCLGGQHQPGEGWSDWWALAYTAEVGDAGTDKRGMGTYLFGEPSTGDGIRSQPYSLDPAINDYDYEQMNIEGLPHGVGSVWAQAIWEVYWALVDVHGFDPNLHDPSPWAGNHRAMLYVNEGIKGIPCSPDFTEIRDSMLQVAADNFGGEDYCTLWQAFADFGLGADADPGPNTFSRNVSNGFEVPLSCELGTCIDDDGDGYGQFGSPLCDNSGADCDDTDPAVNPGASEIPGNGKDDDCNSDTPNGCQQELANASVTAAPSPVSGLPLDGVLYLVPAALLVFGLRRRQRRA